MPNTPRRRAILTGIIAVLTLILPLGAAAPAASAAAGPGADKISPAVRSDLDADGKSTFWVRLKGAADLSAARRARTKEAKAEQVFEAKTEQAAASQAGLRKLLDAQDADYTPYWIVNAVRVTAGPKLAAEIAQLPEVTGIEPVRTLALPKPDPGKAEARVKAVEWNIDRVGAPRVWSELGDRGEGIVVAHIDSGAQFDHPELAAAYRGRNPDGSYTHDYNWFDPAHVCPTAAPCDNNGHGTHTMGTMVGANGIGVAPGARWIAAKGCETNTCTDASLLAAGQWVLAPTDLGGRNPRPDLAPDIVNNSWGGAGFDPWYKETVDAWVAAGIFPAFANGNEGPACRTSGSPGQYVSSYSAGGFDVNGTLYARSSKGEGENGEIKPNIAAPAVNVRSSVPGGGYDSYTGTSMASPHVAATVALLWSAAPALQGDVAATRPLLDSTAIDVNDTSCGGTAADNNVWGEGRLDAYAAVQAAPRDGVGDLAGTVTSTTGTSTTGTSTTGTSTTGTSGGGPVAGATVTLTGPVTRTVVTGQDGTYAVPRLLPGDYRITAEKFGYDKGTGTATVVAGQSARADVTMAQHPQAVLSGTVTAAGTPEAGATVEATGTPVRTVTDAAGRYRLTLPHGDYTITVTPSSRCSRGTSVGIVLTGDTVKDIELGLRGDGFGYTCRTGAEPYVAGTDKLALTGDDDAQQVTLPFPVPFYGTGQAKAWIATNGMATFAADKVTSGGNGRLPTTGTPNNAVYPYWDDLVVDASAGVYTGVTGTAPHRQFVIEWRNVRYYNDAAQRISFAALLGEDGTVSYRYKDVDSQRDQGTSATVGIENATGADGMLYSFEEPALTNGQSLTFAASRHGLVSGVVTDANDGDPLPGATVKIGDVATLTTGPDGAFSGQVLAGDYQVEVSKENYGTFSKPVTIAPGTITRIDTALVTGRVSSSIGEITLVMPAEASRTRTFELTNLGSPTAYTVTADPAQSWLAVTPTAGDLAKDQRVMLKVTASSTGVQPGTLRSGKLVIRSASGRQPVIEVKVTVVVPKYQVAVDAGASKGLVDAAGDSWTADRKYTQGDHGWVATSNRTASTSKTIKGTDDQTLFRTAREGVLEYRFDGVPAGTYTVELDFADTRSTGIGKRVFDVLVEGQLAIPALDLALEAGTYTAVARQYTVKVTDGQLNVRFATREGSTIVNAVRVSERPDKATP
ncbi:carboxypeptidase regulatory-like domain-containing protein [Nonomuraea sp. SMC257]|uniref:Carboxypeptidase regulatory-like domain-containing protein n=1 Tax=Nonomuraea montanisoli TaxID=2741721 RepID=A0A7Y6IDG6_9ACTN|nr:S8 family serine peptidase [Nonomuraea montanisoli]NUW36238.1 carboxypeptidase regulatory-like domain-containing protein [Nonomuraea montanisoli]